MTNKTRCRRVCIGLLTILMFLSACGEADNRLDSDATTAITTSADTTSAIATPADTTSAIATPTDTTAATASPADTAAPAPAVLETTQEPDSPSAQLAESVTVTPTPIATNRTKTNAKRLPLEGIVIGLDPGHQLHGNSKTEPDAPGSSTMKKKVSSGTQGVSTRTPEHEVNLAVGLLLRDLLLEQGATVIMTRETHDVDISNVERAQLFNDAETDYALRLHCNGTNNSRKHGAFMLVPKENPFQEECRTAAEILIDAYCAETGAKNLGITIRDDQTGFNWCERMIINIEMGHMTNKEEDIRLSDPAYQKKMALGLCDGILQYFDEK